jgi:membrane protease YdiL (CAAX protease family)
MSRLPATIMALAIAFEAGIVAFAWVLGQILHQPAFALVTFSWWGLAGGLAATIPLLAVVFVVMRAQSGLFRPVVRDIDDIVVPLFAGWPLVGLGLLSVLAGIGEEALFRGVLLGAITGWTSVPIAVVATAAAFGLAHLISAHYAILAGLIGLYLAWITVFAQNTFPAMVAHATYDFVALVYLVRVRAPAIDAGAAQAEDAAR